MKKLFECVKFNGKIYAYIIRNDYKKDGVEFFTPDEFSQQLAYMKHPVNKDIAPHIHNAVPREVHYTQEVLLIRKGKLRVDFYTQEKSYLESRILAAGDVILLAEGGHGFHAVEELEMIEVKQGPYAGEADKVRFEGVSLNNVIIKG